MGLGCHSVMSADYVIWNNPNSAPYQGDLNQAADAFIRNGADPNIINILKSKYLEHRCYERSLQDREIIDMMMSGKYTVLKNVIVSFDQWKKDQTKIVIECPIMISNGSANPIVYKLLYPYICGNWSYQISYIGLKPVYSKHNGNSTNYYPGDNNTSGGNINTYYTPANYFYYHTKPSKVDEPNTSYILVLALIWIVLYVKHKSQSSVINTQTGDSPNDVFRDRRTNTY